MTILESLNCLPSLPQHLIDVPVILLILVPMRPLRPVCDLCRS